ncbi:MAG: diacylglycerol/lipid kinase family protein [Pirellula sp.]|jgi:diacylglycerol kinase family enzyme
MSSTQARRIVIAANPKSGSSSGIGKAQGLKAELELRGWQVDLTTDLDQMEAMVGRYETQGQLRTVVSAGGDGTAAAVLNRISVEIPLTIFPLGSENLLAQQYCIPRDVGGIAQMVEGMAMRELDLFRANGRLFLIMVSVGFDAKVVQIVHENRRSHVTRWAYRLGILQAIWQYRWPPLEVQSLMGDRWEGIGSSHWLFGFNVPRYAAGIHIMDEAIADDGLIDIGMLEGGSVWSGFWNYVRVAMGIHRRSKRWRETRVMGLRVSGPGDQVGYQIDGDYGGPLPLEIIYTGTKAKLVVP